MAVVVGLGAVEIIVMSLLAAARLRDLHCDATQASISTKPKTGGVRLHIVLDDTQQQDLQTSICTTTNTGSTK